MMRVVLDTNVIVSALLQPLGPPAEVFLLAISGAIQLYVTGAVYAEYEEVIRRPKLRRTDEVILSTLQAIREKALWVRPTGTARACPDPADDIFIECAQAAIADYLITGNLKHFPSTWSNTKIVSPRSFLEHLLAEKDEN